MSAAAAAVFSFPTTIVFGPGSIGRLNERLGALGAHKPLVITDPGLRATKAFERVMSVLPSRCHVFSETQPNPREQDVDAAAGAFTGHGCDAVVGLGGGSALDVAKVLRLRVTFPQWKLDQPPPDARPGKLAPFVAVPTTAGTGS